MKSILLITSLFIGCLVHAKIEVRALQAVEAEMQSQQDSYLSQFFGNVQIGMSSYAAWQITNNSDEVIELLSARLSGIMYKGTSTCQRFIEPRSQCQIDIRFSPFSEGYHGGKLDMIFNKGGNLYFDFWGYGVR